MRFGRTGAIAVACVLLYSATGCGSSMNANDELMSGARAASNGDYEKAVSLFSSVSDDGNKEEQRTAEYNLGVLYRDGNGVGQSYQDAESHFFRSAKLGYGPACLALADLYSSGVLGNKDWHKAILNMGSAQMFGTEVSPSLKKEILSHFTPMSVSVNEILVRYSENTQSDVSGIAHRGDAIYVVPVGEEKWALIYVEARSGGFMGYVQKPITNSIKPRVASH